MINQPNESPELPRIGIVIPACDEEPCIGAVLDELLGALDRRKYAVAVGVNGSRDRTAEIARQHGVVVAETDARGYGHGCMAAIAALRREVPSIRAYVFFAADGASDPSDVELLAGAYEAGHEFVLGTRTAMRSNWRAMTLSHVIANFALGMWCSLLSGRWFTDLAPLRLIERTLFEAMGLRELTYGWTMESQIAAATLRARICQLRAHERPRIAGMQKVSGVSWARTFSIGCRIVAAGWRTDLRLARRIQDVPADCAAELLPQSPTGVLKMRSVTSISKSVATPLAVGAAVMMFAACASKPPLPKYASVEAAARQSSEENFAALVPEADVVYFPVESASHGGRSDPAAQLLSALQKTGAPLAIAWDIIDASQQPLLDQLQGAQGAAREEIVGRLELDGTGRAREYCRSVLRAAGSATIRHLAIGSPAPVNAKVLSGEPLNADEQALVPRGFRAPAGEMETFAERLAGTRPASGDIAGLYRAHLFSEQFAAEKIAQHFQGGGGGKLLVFLRKSDLEPGRGVPYFVPQKVQLRQLVFGSDRSPSGTKLLTDLRSPAPRLEVVESAPGAARQ